MEDALGFLPPETGVDGCAVMLEYLNNGGLRDGLSHAASPLLIMSSSCVPIHSV